MCLVEKEDSAHKFALEISRKNSLPSRKISTEMCVTEQKVSAQKDQIFNRFKTHYLRSRRIRVEIRMHHSHEEQRLVKSAEIRYRLHRIRHTPSDSPNSSDRGETFEGVRWPVVLILYSDEPFACFCRAPCARLVARAWLYVDHAII